MCYVNVRISIVPLRHWSFALSYCSLSHIGFGLWSCTESKIHDKLSKNDFLTQIQNKTTFIYKISIIAGFQKLVCVIQLTMHFNA